MSERRFVSVVVHQVLAPLVACYLISFVIAYTHIGNLFGTSFGTTVLLVKLVFVTAACLAAVFYFCRRLARVCTEHQVSQSYTLAAQAALITVSMFLLFSTPGWAVALGVSYR